MTYTSRTPLESADPAVLLGWIAQGRRDALRELYNREKGRLFRLLLTRLRSRELAEDVLAETFLRAWRKAATYDPYRGAVETWLSTLAQRLATDALRRRGREPDAAVGGESLPDRSSPEPCPLEAGLFEERRVLVRRALGELPPPQRRAVEAVFFEGRTHSQAAHHLRAPLGTLKGRIRLALAHLERRLADFAEQDQ